MASRIFIITRAGVYDLGTLRLEKAGWLGEYSLAARGMRGSAERSQQLWRAVEGTSWERLVASSCRGTR